MEGFTKESLRIAILTEKRSFDFYRRAAQLVSDEHTRKVCELLAAKEAEHMDAFLAHYPGDEFGDLWSLISQAPDITYQTYRSLQAEIDSDTREQQALEISLREKQACIEHYTMLAACLRKPTLSAIFEQALSDTRRHYELINDEYMRIMGMVDHSDQDIYVRE